MRRLALRACAILLLACQTAGAATYYVNDSVTTGDLYTIAKGNAANTGLTASSPKASLQDIVDTYDLEPGDRIYVDAGTYTLNAPITWGANDSGSSSAPVQILGVPGGSNTKLVGSGTAYALVIGTGCEWVTVRSITAQSATTAGIAILGGKDISLVDCTVQNNTGSGIYAEAAVRMSVQSCVVSGNGSAGIFCSRSSVPTITSSTVYGNPQSLFFEETPGAQVDHCLLYRGTATAISTHVRLLRSGGLNMQFCTVYDSSTGIAFFESTSCRFRNNIISVKGAGASCIFIDSESQLTLDANYNDLHAATGAAVAIKDGILYSTFTDWKTVSGRDANSLSADPLFVAPATGVFYLMSTQGHYGQTGVVGDSSSSPCIDAADPALPVLDEPAPNGGRANMGRYGQTLMASRTPTHVARTYYVNDEVLTGDIYVTAIGGDDNTGLTPDQPLLSMEDLLAKYQLGAGDTVYIDTGTYELSNALTITAAMSGSAAAPLLIVGSDRGTVFAASDEMPYAVTISGASYVTMKNITCHGAMIAGFHVAQSANILLQGVRSRDNTYGGIHLTGSTGITIRNALIYRNAAAGLRAEGSDGIAIDLSTLYQNGREIQLVGSKNLSLTNSIVNARKTGSACFAFDDTGNVGYSGRYNLFYLESGAVFGTWVLERQTLSDWQGATGQELTSMAANPLFVMPPASAANDAAIDFHLQSLTASYHGGNWQPDAQHSPGIDAADPAVSPAAEPEDNGDRANLGAYGATGQAGKSRNSNIIHGPFYSTYVPTYLSCTNVGTGPASVTLYTTNGAQQVLTLQAGQMVRKTLQSFGVPEAQSGAFSLVASGSGAQVIADAWVLDGTVPRYVPVQPAHSTEQGSLFAIDRNTAARFDTRLVFFNPSASKETLTLSFLPGGSAKTSVSHIMEMPALSWKELNLADTLVTVADGSVGSFTVSGANATQMAGWVDMGAWKAMPVTVAGGNTTMHVPVAFSNLIQLVSIHNNATTAVSVSLPAVIAKAVDPARAADAVTLPVWLSASSPLSAAAGRGAVGIGAAIGAREYGWGGALVSTGGKLVGDSHLILGNTAIFWMPLRNNALGGRTSYYESRPSAGVETFVAMSNPQASVATSITLEITDSALRRNSVSLPLDAGRGTIMTLRELAGSASIAETGWLRFAATQGVIAMTWVYDAPAGRVYPVPVQPE